jgi:DNA-binding GntR family transcriptional regulator
VKSATKKPKPEKGRRSRVASKRLSDQVFEHLKDEIVFSRLEPGAIVTETELTRKYGFSITPLRRALVQLAECELLLPLRRQGYQVATVSLKAINDVFDARALIEPHLSGAAARKSTPELIKELERLDAVCQKGCVVGDFEGERRFLSANREFHQQIARAVGNKHLERFHSQVLDETQRIFFIVMHSFGAASRLQHSHSELIAAIKATDSAEAKRLSEREVNESRQVFVNAITSTEAFQMLDISTLRPVGAERKSG